MTQRDGLFRLSVLIAAAMSMTLVWLVLRQLGMPDSLSPEALSQWLNSRGALGPLLLLGLMVMTVVVGPLPTLPITAAAGLAFGILPGALLAVSGSLAGALIAFFLARLLGRDLLRERFRDNPLFGAQGSQRLLFVTVLLTRLIPIFSFALISYAAGVTAISAWRFALASVIGMLPMTLVFASLGQAFELHPLLSMTAAVMILAVMALLPWYLSRHRQSRLARWLGLD
ncbi:TVP38/TMEM64 family protein [Halomonas campisalis]|uniref:TVP38/TMEM64 family membrane protein n=1 Tax=Billgrantia campisalis TaxID=74661 RepID=A0ABS9PCK9_9GAMM|nr:TVP38/TMEM64 family protein [Halomonas campisalis]MCG6658830.1 TVP38/TMEM64 family protein [Halomonas campisalis]MDR5864521.1 TVP38/TMEM64 family protein [Halomonas campisalis]